MFSRQIAEVSAITAGPAGAARSFAEIKLRTMEAQCRRLGETIAVQERLIARLEAIGLDISHAVRVLATCRELLADYEFQVSEARALLALGSQHRIQGVRIGRPRSFPGGGRSGGRGRD